MDRQKLIRAAAAFEGCDKDNILSVTRHGHGHINDTYLLQLRSGRFNRLILQRINTDIFTDPIGLMDNILKVTEHIRATAIDPLRETLTVIRTRDGRPCYRDEDGSYWRIYLYIENAVCLEKVDNPRDFYESAVSFGHFQRQLSDFPADSLIETIPDFHNTVKRYLDFEKAVSMDIAGRAASAMQEIAFVRNRREMMSRGELLRKNGELPLRVTHNDTKLNNIMMDPETGRGICIIDLDTVMPGLSIYDFGDSIRFGANTADEDEMDLSKVGLDLELYRLYVQGFIKGAEDSLTRAEIDNLSYGAWNMTMECGMRFLTDHLNGDVYFKTARAGHNLCRARNQFKLAMDMEDKRDEMKMIVDDCNNKRGLVCLN
ncbi:phosphotransferase enzyme family protein [Butyrivibrio sp. MC2013]|uniref:phosphotransferase enzyme family protein n=1 Tax=Butyrivibrio sp. MC2013 TaxID=1280686 RepID=UPI00041F0913|nr:aminoglycoside phosphotransferase family protein [Butyrivibrio sp. MC2013]